MPELTRIRKELNSDACPLPVDAEPDWQFAGSSKCKQNMQRTSAAVVQRMQDKNEASSTYNQWRRTDGTTSPNEVDGDYYETGVNDNVACALAAVLSIMFVQPPQFPGPSTRVTIRNTGGLLAIYNLVLTNSDGFSAEYTNEALPNTTNVLLVSTPFALGVTWEIAGVGNVIINNGTYSTG